MLADELDFVIGVDTHRDTHTFCVVAASSGARLEERLITADERGYAAALALAVERADGRRAWAIEGSGSYGQGLARFLAEQGERVLEVERPARTAAGGRGKSDALDALRAARAALGAERPATPRSGGGVS
jgi:transposase